MKNMHQQPDLPHLKIIIFRSSRSTGLGLKKAVPYTSIKGTSSDGICFIKGLIQYSANKSSTTNCTSIYFPCLVP